MPLKLTPAKNPNYAAVVVRITATNPLEGSDNIVGTPLLGFQAIVGKGTQIGDVGIVFPAECQLSDAFCRENNLYRHSDNNKDESAKGYIEDNRRIRAVKFRGHRSDCLFMPLDSLAYTGVDVSALQVGDVFDEINGHKICEKYQVRRRTSNRAQTKAAERFNRVDERFFPQHFDSENYFRNADTISPATQIVVTQKLHGTSWRGSHTIVARKLSFFEHILKRLSVRIATSDYDYVWGSRKVIKDINNPDGGFYSTDIWTEYGKRLEGVIPQNFILYGELVGYTPDGGDIQKGYHYGLPVGTNELYVYRVAFVNAQGRIVDLVWDQVKAFCTELGLKYVPELWRGRHDEFDAQSWMDKRYAEVGYPQAIPLDDNGTVDEGVCIRVDGLVPYILKAKSPIFLQHESKMLDQEATDLEAEESQAAEEASDA
jgi:hypothetical protein